MRPQLVWFRIWRLMIAGAVVALCIQSIIWTIEFQPGSRRIPGPAKVDAAARNEIPGLIITSVLPEIDNQQKAWEVRGTDQKGIIRLICVWDSGEVIYAEPIAHLPPPSVAEPIPDF